MATEMETTYFERQNLQIIADKIFKVCDEDGTRVETKIFFSIPFDVVIKPFEEKLGLLYKWRPGSPGMPPFPPVAMFKAIVYAKLNKNMSDCELERELRRNPHVAAALGFDDVPDHQTISLFKRERLTVSLLNDIFNALRDYLVNADWIDLSSVTIDSAPLEAFVNLGKANKEIKLNDALARALIEDSTYQSLAADVIVAMGYKKGGTANMKKRIANLNHVLLYELGGFLSQAKVIKYLDKAEHAALLKAVSGGIKMPSEPTMSTFKKQLMGIIKSPAFEAFRSHVGKYLAGISTPRDTSVEMLFPGLFAALQTSYSYVDPDARLGYCATKKLVFLGYRVQLLIDDKKSCL
ncbi:MAG: transposase [Candidatus Lokiarchaeota archaeon]|nr:transposase [Candidatus Lokiarchaeota archaeon]